MHINEIETMKEILAGAVVGGIIYGAIGAIVGGVTLPIIIKIWRRR